jgi:pSer/pThr/pTyr-binding forkhead associated (FHA) protein
MAYIGLIIDSVIINKWELMEDVTIFGRSKDSDIPIDDQSVSSKHARVIAEPDPFLDGNQIWYLEDLKSTNGTLLNGMAVSKKRLNDGDNIKIGFTEFQFIDNTSDSGRSDLGDTSVILS